jgi:hypothetical protein
MAKGGRGSVAFVLCDEGNGVMAERKMNESRFVVFRS